MSEKKIQKTTSEEDLKEEEKLLLGEISLLLSEKRTYLSLLRTGIAVFTIPITILAFMLATEQFHGIFKNFWSAVIVTVGLALIAVLGLWIFFHAEKKISKINHMVEKIENENKRIAELVP